MGEEERTEGEGVCVWVQGVRSVRYVWCVYPRDAEEARAARWLSASPGV